MCFCVESKESANKLCHCEAPKGPWQSVTPVLFPSPVPRPAAAGRPRVYAPATVSRWTAPAMPWEPMIWGFPGTSSMR